MGCAVVAGCADRCTGDFPGTGGGAEALADDSARTGCAGWTGEIRGELQESRCAERGGRAGGASSGISCDDIIKFMW